MLQPIAHRIGNIFRSLTFDFSWNNEFNLTIQREQYVETSSRATNNSETATFKSINHVVAHENMVLFNCLTHLLHCPHQSSIPDVFSESTINTERY